MGNGVSTSTDKNIVDMSRSHKNKAVAKAVRATRDKLQSGHAEPPRFEREMLLIYINSVIQSASILPLFIITVAVVGTLLTGQLNIILWSVVVLTVHAFIAVAARRASRQELTVENSSSWKKRFLAGQTLMGLCWAYYAVQTCDACNLSTFSFYKAGTLLLALSAVAMAHFMIRNALIVTFLPVSLALLINAILFPTTSAMSMTALFSATLVLFLYITALLHNSNIKLLTFQVEKDDLIAELEVAKSMSDEARRRAEEANMAKSRFLASMSHELRTPLNAILGFSEVMATEVLGPLNNPTYKEYTNDIHRSGQHLLNLINEILDLSRIEAGRYDLHEEAVMLCDIAEDCIGMVQLRARAKNIRITDQFERNMPAIWADEKAMRQVMLNLLSNAVKFTPQNGEIAIKVGWTSGGGQYVSIKDNGPGIAEEEIPVVLSAFGQGSIAIKSAEQGTGLGLPIVQAILDKHNGQFLFKSKLRQGTEVIAILPAKRVLSSVPAVGETHAVPQKRKSFG
jgi:two-component system, cell cycle sensor histidine kinase PleC